MDKNHQMSKSYKKSFYLFVCHIYKKKSSPANVTNQIEESISKMICILEKITMIDRFIKGIESLNIDLNELNLIHKLNDEARIQLIDRLIRFNECANNLNIKLIKEPENCILNTTEYISNEKILI